MTAVCEIRCWREGSEDAKNARDATFHINNSDVHPKNVLKLKLKVKFFQNISLSVEGGGCLLSFLPKYCNFRRALHNPKVNCNFCLVLKTFSKKSASSQNVLRLHDLYQSSEGSPRSTCGFSCSQHSSVLVHHEILIFTNTPNSRK